MRTTLALVLAAGMFVGCAASSVTPRSALQQPKLVRHQPATIPYLYVTGFSSFSSDAPTIAVIPVIPNATVRPVTMMPASVFGPAVHDIKDMYADQSGHLYVLTTYIPGTSQAPSTDRERASTPNRRQPPAVIGIYEFTFTSPTHYTLTRTITGSNVLPQKNRIGPEYLANLITAANDGTIYVSSYVEGVQNPIPSIYVYGPQASGNVAPSASIIVSGYSWGTPSGNALMLNMVVDPTNGNLDTLSEMIGGCGDVFNVYAPGASGEATPVAQFAPDKIDGDLGVDATGTIHTLLYDGVIGLFPEGTTAPLTPGGGCLTLATVPAALGPGLPLNPESLVEFDSIGTTYIFDPGLRNVAIYGPSEVGQVVPTMLHVKGIPSRFFLIAGTNLPVPPR